MARQSSKIMSIAEKKVAQAGLKTALKNHNESIKAIDLTLKDAEKVLTAAKKQSDDVIKALNKEQATVAKKAETDVKAAQKAFDAVVAQHAKSTAAAAKGTEKLMTQAAALEATPTGPNVRPTAASAAPASASKSPKDKARAEELETA